MRLLRCGTDLIQRCYSCVAPLFFMTTRRVSFSVSPETVAKLAALAKWQHRTPSQQIDALVHAAVADLYASLSVEQKQVFTAHFQGA